LALGSLVITRLVPQPTQQPTTHRTESARTVRATQVMPGLWSNGHAAAISLKAAGPTALPAFNP
jgi:hypothetical protein